MMRKQELLNKLKLLGYPLFETDETPDAGETLAEVVKSREPRLWEAFPLLLANCLEKNCFHNEKAEKNLGKKSDKARYRKLVLLSLALYKYLRLGASWADKLSTLEFFNKKLVNVFTACFDKKKKFPKGVDKLSPERVVATFSRYYNRQTAGLNEYAQMKDEADLEYSLSQVFSRKQKELFLKKLKGEKMTKTEKEYYSRSVKKKVQALANSDLHNLAAKLAKE